MIYMTYLGIKQKRNTYLFIAGAALGLAVQLHYLALLLSPIFVLISAINTNWRSWPKTMSLYVSGSIFTFSPFLAFEIFHNFPNFRTILEFITRGTNVGYNSYHFLWLTTSTGNILLEEISNLTGTVYTKITLWSLLLLTIHGIYKNFKNKNKKLAFSIGIVWFFGGLLFLRMYTGTLNNYYFGFIFPAPFFLLGLTFQELWENKYFRIIPIIYTATALIWFLNHSFYKSSPNKLIEQTKDIANQTIQKSGNQSYNFAMISDHNSDHAYRYFLEASDNPPTQLETLVTDQLLILCESKTCSPLGNPLWEIAGFGRGEIAGEWKLEKYGFTIFRLIHWPGAPSPAGKPAVKGG